MFVFLRVNLISQNNLTGKGCAGGDLGLGFGCAHVSASVHWVFGVLVSILHDWGCIMGGRHKNFKDLMYRN